MCKCERCYLPCVFFLRAPVSKCRRSCDTLPPCMPGRPWLAVHPAPAAVGGLPPPCTQHPGVGGMYAGGDRGHAPAPSPPPPIHPSPRGQTTTMHQEVSGILITGNLSGKLHFLDSRSLTSLTPLGPSGALPPVHISLPQSVSSVQLTWPQSPVLTFPLHHSHLLHLTS